MKRKIDFSDKSGFTLVELIVVIAILAILGGTATVGYSGYIKKTNEAADKQLISDIEQALILGAYSKNYAPGSTVGAVSVSKDVNGSCSTDDFDSNGTGDVEEMMVSAFGGNWREIVKFQGDSFATSDSAKIAEAIQAAEKADGSNIFDSVPGSSFYSAAGNTEAIVADVDEIASALNGVLEGMGPTTFGMFWGDGFHESVGNAGLSADWKNDDQMAANLTVFAAANQIAGSDDAAKDAWLANWGKNENVVINSSQDGYVADLVMNYAKCVALYNYVQNADDSVANAKQKENVKNQYTNLTNAMTGLKNPSDAGYVVDFQNALNAFNTATASYYTKWQTAPEGGKSQAQIDAEAFLASMTAINSMEDNYVNKSQKELLGNANAFAKAGAAGVLDTMVNYAKMGTLPSGDYVIVLSVAADGTPIITPTLAEE